MVLNMYIWSAPLDTRISCFLQRAQARKLEFENKALVLQTDHGLQKEAIAKIAQQFAGKQVNELPHPDSGLLYVSCGVAWL